MTSMKYRKPMLLLFITVATLCLIGVSIVLEWNGLSNKHYIAYDYAFFYYAFHAVLQHQTSWSNLYSISKQHIFLAHYDFPSNPYNQYVYPPQFAVLFGWMALFPFWVSAVFWMILSGTLYYLGLYWTAKTLWSQIRRIHLIYIFLAASALTPFQIDMAVGNVNSVLFSGIALTFFLHYKKHKSYLAGIPLGIAILMKVTPAALLLIWVLRKEWKLCISTCLTATIGTIISSFIVGVSPIYQYLFHFSSFGHTSMKNGPAPYNQSVIGVLGMFSQHHWMTMPNSVQNALFMIMSALALLGIIKSLGNKRNTDWRLDMGLAALTPTVFSPLVEQAHMVLSIPALLVFVWILSQPSTVKSRRLLLALGAVTISCVLAESLPATFFLNFIVAHWPGYFFIHIQTFLVLATTFCTILWLYRPLPQHATLAGSMFTLEDSM